MTFAERFKNIRFSTAGFLLVIIGQAAIYYTRLFDFFIDGRFHVNWGPPFWLIKAEFMHKVNFFSAFLGAVSGIGATPTGLVATGWYSSHPQFIAIPLYLWTGLFGFHEASIRSLAAVCTLATTALFWFALRKRFSSEESFVFLTFFASLPLMIIFGNKLDQEPFVLLFLALGYLALERERSAPTRFPVLWLISIIGMMWSDWSGFIFAGLFFLAFLIAGRWHRGSRRLAGATVIGGVIGLLIVLLQTFGEQGFTSEIIKNMANLYRYRAGSDLPAGFRYMWMQRQFIYVWLNFGWVVGYVAIAFGIYKLRFFRAHLVEVQKSGLGIQDLFAITALGTLIYAAIVPQATAIHVYYQYFYGPLIAFLLMRLFFWLESFVRTRRLNVPLHWCLIVAVVCLGLYSGITSLFQDISSGWGSPAEIEMLKIIGRAPVRETAAFLGAETNLYAWFDNPNIDFYAHRRIDNAPDPEQAVRYDWIVLGSGNIEQKRDLLVQFSHERVVIDIVGCTPHLCLLHKKIK